jgi:drug/metabolite transporter (DMT)-like permease
MAFSIALLGDRALISGNLFSFQSVLRLVLHWKFMLSMCMALFARVAFILVNNSLLSIPRLATNSTTVTAFVLVIAYIAVVIVNGIFLKESLSVSQYFGASMIIVGLLVMLR